MNPRVSVVIGAGFGDEGKGRTVSDLVEFGYKPVVIRFNGGHQAGHTVVKNGVRHVFSHFGSGTLHGAPTFWSRFCTIYPLGLLREFKALIKLGISPKIFFDPQCPITTPWDGFKQREDLVNRKHGTCGVGFGTTLEREAQNYHLKFKDLFFPKVFKAKLAEIETWYKNQGVTISASLKEEFLTASQWLRENYLSQFLFDFHPREDQHLIFEGAQGILLDQEFGFFPHVTRSHTTIQNALTFLKENEITPDNIEVYLVSRTYQTRHGAGFMSDQRPLVLIGNENETNCINDYQGDFRVGLLDLDLLQYSLNCHSQTAGSIPHNTNLVFTCVDQIPGDTVSVIFREKVIQIPKSSLGKQLNYSFKRIWHFHGSDCSQSLLSSVA